MTTVRFHHPSDFLAEVARDVGLIERRIVRVTRGYRRNREAPTVQFVSVLASYELPSGQVVQLDAACGDWWGAGDDGALRRADEVARRIEDACRDLDLEVRGGIVEEATT